MIGCFGWNGKREEGFRLFKRMVEQGIRPNRATFLNVIPCAVNGEVADELYSFVIRNGLQFDLAMQNALVGMFARCRKVGFARHMFDRMPVKDLVSWSSMIEGYGQNDMYLEALQLFRNTRVLGVKPDSVTVLGIIRACANSMLSCLTHARFIHVFVIRNFLDKNLVSETALVDMYVKRGKGKEADKVKGLMRRKGVKRNDGFTVIEVKNRVYKFLVGDKTKPQSSQIYVELEKLMARIKREGYVPDTNFALHDVEEETKERSLAMHSEKLAIVFGLMNSAPGSVIRIHKNLRVCGDCHNATKYISKVTKREILVRDSHRFHHFKDGLCSCGDYW
ncbi:Pentatricopeptide repeat-containing protein [Rhynchospora pubera]|uniref:Pentatricopeptide repeat-containing protein n=1 Tax=Rhynchospora pubera TaxID=906938 RepID=A0AAV8ENN3_9POAL|nr:Pentatricopeptide repeat-containing protein [Rhynchospora pubera]